MISLPSVLPTAIARATAATEILLALESTSQPSWKKATLELISPWLLELLVGWYNASSGDDFDEPDSGVDEHVRDNATDQAVSDGVGEWHNSQSDESWESISKVLPVNVLCGLAHHSTNDNESTSGSPWWDGGEDWCKENGNEEA